MAKPKLCQIVAVVSGMKTANQANLTRAHHVKPDLLAGLTRNYRPKTEDGEPLPAEVKRVQQTVPAILKDVAAELAKTLDAVRTLDEGNTRARADVKVGGLELKAVPVPHLLYLETRLDDLITFIDGLPVLDPSEQWKPSGEDGIYQTEPYETLKTAKVMKTHVAYEATDKHPAQTQTYTVDETVGTWTNIKYSGAVRQADKTAMLGRARSLRDAVKMAREEANSAEVDQYTEGKAILDHVFGPVAAS